MASPAAVRLWSGAVAGSLVIGAAALLAAMEILPAPAILPSLFAAGLVSGLLAKGTIKDGAMTGAACGGIGAATVTLALTIMSLSNSTPQFPQFWQIFCFYGLIIAIVILPYTTIAGAVGTTVRNIITRRGAMAGTHHTAGVNEQARWFGIGSGSIVITGSIFFIGSLGPLLIIPPFIGGLIAGYSGGGGVKDGLETGLITAFFGTGFFVLPLLWTASHAEGIVAGLAAIAAIVSGYLFLIFGTAGGIAGSVVRRVRREPDAVGGD
jgi:hypothetical protein